jgi:hypothetical protein
VSDDEDDEVLATPHSKRNKMSKKAPISRSTAFKDMDFDLESPESTASSQHKRSTPPAASSTSKKASPSSSVESGGSRRPGRVADAANLAASKALLRKSGKTTKDAPTARNRKPKTSRGQEWPEGVSPATDLKLSPGCDRTQLQLDRLATAEALVTEVRGWRVLDDASRE